MLLTTLSINATDYWQFRGADWIGVIIALIGIGLSVAIFIMQRRTEKEVRYLQRSNISDALEKIALYLSIMKDIIGHMNMSVNYASTNTDKRDEINHLLQAYDRWFKDYPEMIAQESQFVRAHITSKLYDDIEAANVRIQTLTYDPSMFTIEEEEYVDHWIKLNKSAIEQIDKVIQQIDSLLEKLKK